MASINSQRAPSSIVTFLMGIGCLAVFAAVIVAWTKMRAPKADLVDAERGTARLKKREELETEWSAKLQTVAWVNKEKGEVQVPIEEAMKVVAVELKGKKITKSEVKLPAPMPPPVIDPKSTEPPPLPMPSAPQGADLVQFSNPFAPVPAALPPAAPAPAAPTPPPPPLPLPPAPAETAIPAPAVPPLSAGAPSRPPLINWTESK